MWLIILIGDYCFEKHTRINLRASTFQKFPGGACPQTP